MDIHTVDRDYFNLLACSRKELKIILQLVNTGITARSLNDEEYTTRNLIRAKIMRALKTNNSNPCSCSIPVAESVKKEPPANG